MHTGDASAEEVANTVQIQGPVPPIVRGKSIVDIVTVTDELKANKACSKLMLELLSRERRKVGMGCHLHLIRRP